LWKSYNPVCGSAAQDYTTNAYDALGRLTDVTAPGSAVTHTSYNGNVATTQDPAKLAGDPSLRYQRQVTTDALGRIQSVTENGTYTTSYSYDAIDNLTCVAQGGQFRVFQYDEMGRLKFADNPETAPSALTSCTPPGGGRATMRYTYDNAGNVLSRTDTASSTIGYTPDALNRVASKTTSEGSVSFTYDQSFAITGETDTNYPIGRLTSVSFGTLASHYRYDSLGRYRASQQNVDTNPAYIFHYDSVPAGLQTMKYLSSIL
jgi:YD repeat-containing protein